MVALFCVSFYDSIVSTDQEVSSAFVFVFHYFSTLLDDLRDSFLDSFYQIPEMIVVEIQESLMNIEN
jgi:hypothetical protein